MANIIDRRTTKKRSSQNRQRFIKRYKRQLQKQVNSIGDKKRGITDFDKSEDVNVDDLTEPTFRHRSNSGKRDIVLPGNKELGKGDVINKPSGGSGARGKKGGDGEDTTDEFTFTLTKEEFMDIYFSDMALPRFIKDSILKSKSAVRRKAGYTKEGIPARLNLKKSFENAIARKLIAKARGKKARFIDDTDLRYDYYKQEYLPKKHAVMLCLLDVSASMFDHERTLARKFFLLLYLFLEKSYTSVEVRFITHTTSAMEVPEEDFFYGRRSGGTMMSSALKLADKIITEDYDLNTVNVYVAQVSDGDNWYMDDRKAKTLLIDNILPKVQYYAYVQVAPEDIVDFREGNLPTGFYRTVKEIESEKCKATEVYKSDLVYPALRELFKKDS